LKTVSYAVGLAGSFFEAIMGLTVKKVAKLMNAGERGRFFDDAGMYLVIGGKNSANWTRRYELDHRAHWMGLGSARTFTLDEARVRNREVSKLLADGIDPLVKRRAKRAERKAEQIRGPSRSARKSIFSATKGNGDRLSMAVNGSIRSNVLFIRGLATCRRPQ
jgi:Arm DNA-binding domain